MPQRPSLSGLRHSLRSGAGERRHKRSAGLLLYRRTKNDLEILLAHPGGPFWKNRDEAAWTIPKGLIEEGEDELAAARREFFEETGHAPQGPFAKLGAFKQPGGKTVTAFAAEGDFNPANLHSNSFKMEWPPRSGTWQSFPEIDKAEWFDIKTARSKILKGQAAMMDALLEKIA